MMQVAWPYVTIRVKGADGKIVLREFYKDAPVPAGADPADVERLVRKGALIDNGSNAAPAEETDDATQHPDRPADNANKAAWVDYAVATRDEGVSEDEARTAAEAMTKADLITLHG